MVDWLHEVVHGAWRADAVNRADQLRGEIVRLRGVDGADAGLLTQASDRVEALFEAPAPGRDRPHLRHQRIAVVWDALHDAEETVDRAHGDVVVLTRRAAEHARTTLPLARADEAIATLDAARAAAARADRARDVIVRCHAVSAHHLETMRNNSRLTSVLALIAWAAVVGLLVAQGWLPDDPFLTIPNGTDSAALAMAPWVFLLLVLVFGALGGLVSAITYARNDRIDTRWFNPAPALVAIKIACGALFGMLGALLVSAKVLTSVTYDTLAQALVIALVFGYAQQVLTRVLDRYVAVVEEPTAAESAPAAIKELTENGPDAALATQSATTSGAGLSEPPTSTLAILVDVPDLEAEDLRLLAVVGRRDGTPTA